jgi:hypothetical protein
MICFFLGNIAGYFDKRIFLWFFYCRYGIFKHELIPLLLPYQKNKFVNMVEKKSYVYVFTAQNRLHLKHPPGS